MQLVVAICVIAWLPRALSPPAQDPNGFNSAREKMSAPALVRRTIPFSSDAACALYLPLPPPLQQTLPSNNPLSTLPLPLPPSRLPPIPPYPPPTVTRMSLDAMYLPSYIQLPPPSSNRPHLAVPETYKVRSPSPPHTPSLSILPPSPPPTKKKNQEKKREPKSVPFPLGVI